MAIKESDIKAMMKTVMSSTMQSVSAGRKTVISPTEVRNITKEIVADAESGSIKRFENALNKTEKIIDKLDVNLKDFNSSLAKRVKELGEQRDKSAKEVEALRAQNIVAETKTQKQGKEFRIETNILTKKEIENRKSLLDQRKKIFREEETKILKKRDNLLSKEIPLNKREKEIIIRDEERLQKEKDAIRAEEQILTPLSEKDDMKGPSSTFYEELKAPFLAVGDAFMSLKDIGNDVVRVFQFFTKGGLTKSLKNFAGGIKALGRFFMSTKVLIGLAVAGVIAGILFFRDKIKDAADFIMAIPGKIADFFKSVFTKVTDFFKDMINSVIKLVNKIPGINIPLLKTSNTEDESNIKKEDNKKEQTSVASNIKKEDNKKEQTSVASDEINPYEKKRREKLEKFDEAAYIKASEEKYGSHIAPFELRDREKFKFMRTGKVTDPKELNTLTKENNKMKNQAPVIVNNMANQSNVSSNGAVVSGFVNNKNADDTFLNLNSAMA